MKLPPLPEEAINLQIREGLTALGYLVRSTTVRRARGGYGTSKGIPDLLVTRFGWGCTCELEVKGATTKISIEQQLFAKQGVLTIVRSLEEAMLALAAFESRFTLKGACSMRLLR